MISRIAGVLKTRRTSSQEKEKGFTLIELLVVIVIIGILAAIAIPVYLGVQKNAKDSAVKSDLTNAKIAVIAYLTETNAFPAAIDDTTLSAYGFTKSSNTSTIGYSPVGVPAAAATAFCLTALGITGSDFWVTQSSGVVDTIPATGC